MFGDNLFLDSTADRISLSLMLEELYMLNLYFDVVNRVPVFFLYVSDMLCSYILGVRFLYSSTLGRGVSELLVWGLSYLMLTRLLGGYFPLTFAMLLLVVRS